LSIQTSEIYSAAGTSNLSQDVPDMSASVKSDKRSSELENSRLESSDMDADLDGEDDEDLGSSGTRAAWSDVDSDPAADLQDILKAQMLDKAQDGKRTLGDESEEDDLDLDMIDDILALPEEQFPRFTLAKNKARFLRMVSWYRNKKEWLEVAPLSGVSKLFKQQTKELVGIRASKLDYEMELETGTLTPSQRSYRRDELKMCKVHEKMAVNLIARMQVKIKSGRR
jgi:hypothetical protein